MSPQSSTPWFRLYSEVLSDRKIQRISNTTKQPIAMILGVWTVILALANDSPRRGKLLISEGIPVTFGEIAAACGLADDDCQAILTAFSSMNMLYLDENEVYTVTQWDSRQFTSDNSTERVRKYRERQKGEGETKTPEMEQVDSEYAKRYGNVSVTPPESDTESDIIQEEQAPAPKKRHPDFKAVCETYQYEIGGLSQTVSDTLNDDLGTYPAAWIVEAMKRAAKANARNLNYVEAILKNWQVIGGPQNDQPKGKKNGATSNGKYNQPNKPLQKTGESLDEQPVFNIYTGEIEYPDGRRVSGSMP